MFGDLVMKVISLESEVNLTTFTVFTLEDKILFFDNYKASPIKLMKSFDCVNSICDTIDYSSYHSIVYDVLSPPKPASTTEEIDSIRIDI